MLKAIADQLVQHTIAQLGCGLVQHDHDHGETEYRECDDATRNSGDDRACGLGILQAHPTHLALQLYPRPGQVEPDQSNGEHREQ